MQLCNFSDKRSCGRINLARRARFFFGNTLAEGDIVRIARECICIATRYCIPLDSGVKLFIPVKKKVLFVLARVASYSKTDGDHDVMCLEVLSPSDGYLDFVKNYEKRQFQRTTVYIAGQLIAHEVNCPVVIRDVSKNGLRTAVTPRNTSDDFISDLPVALSFQAPSGETVRLQCIKKWLRPSASDDETKNIGLEVISPPEQYREVLKSLQ